MRFVGFTLGILLCICTTHVASAQSSTASASKQAVARDTTADTGFVLLTPGDLARIDTVAQALQVTVVAHPEFDKKKVDRADPYYIAQKPLLAAVVMQSGWTTMQYYHMFSSYMSAVEKCMSTIFGLPQGNTVADKNVRLVCGGVTNGAFTGSDSSKKKE